MRVGGANIEQMQIRVPVDRTTTRFMLYSVHAPAGVEYPSQPSVPDYQIPVYDSAGRHRVDYVEGQDIMAWITQGPITDRTVEHLGRSDVGVTMLRRMFKEQMSAVARGEDPLGVYRDFRDRVDLPCEKNKFDSGGSFAIDFIERGSSRFSPQADALKKLHLKAMENRKG
jgi:5,5'-dehydrodivanillate O-demethylase